MPSTVLTIPNLLTLGRILAVPGIVAVFYLDAPLANWLALGLFTLASVTDFFDGWLARKMDLQTELGKLLDPIADKLLVSAALLVLVWVGHIDGLSVIAAVIILCREISVSGLREFLAGAQVSVPVTQLAKWKTTVQMFALGFLLAGPAGETILPGNMMIGTIGLWIAALLTLVTGYDYLSKGLSHIVGEDEKRAREKAE